MSGIPEEWKKLTDTGRRRRSKRFTVSFGDLRIIRYDDEARREVLGEYDTKK